ncbi:MAG: polyphosphate polymerase domain-containing protein [Oscillospiraceae bacterium]|nr:polyphosphate polymerase domain-containing protein [Oscillospiraceae bacterium]
MQEIKFRNEYKHIINKNHAAVLKSRLRALLKPDPFADGEGKYFVRSLYFDTYEDKALYEKLDGVPFRYKYRLRFYNFDTSVIKLENKIRRYNCARKISCAVTKEESLKLLNCEYEFLKDLDDPVKFAFCKDFLSEGLTAKTIVDYVRTPFVYPHGNVRVTIDSDIKSSVGQSRLAEIFSPTTPTVSVFPEERCVLEVKYDEFLPDFIHKIIQTEVAMTSSFSKYASCRVFV